MNDINKKQNSERILTLLFSQRKLYSLAKMFKAWIAIVSICLFFVGLIPVMEASYNKEFMIIGCFWTIVFLILTSFSDKNINIAASTQELIDRELYNFRINKNILGYTESFLMEKAYELKGKYRKEYEVQISSDGNLGGVKDWYSDVTNQPLEIATILCQKENVLWDLNLRKRYQWFLVGVLIAIVIICIAIYAKQSVWSLIVFLATGFSLITEVTIYLIKNRRVIINGIEMNEDLNEILPITNNIELSKIREVSQDIQTNIFDRRKSAVSIPNVFYRLTRIKDQIFSKSIISELNNKIKSNS